MLVKQKKQIELRQRNLSVDKSTSPLKKGRSLKTLDQKIKEILETLRERHWTIGVMESCTGGEIVNSLTNIPGASDVFGVGKVTYSVKAKIEAGVDEKIIEKWGVYSKETAEEMARKITGEIGVGVTGNLPGEVFVVVRVGNKVESRKLKVESKDKNEIEARKEMKMNVVERVAEMISDNL